MTTPRQALLTRADEDLPTDPTPTRSAPRPSRQVQRRLVPGEIVAMVEAYRSGARVGELAARFGVHPATVSRALEREGVRERTRSLSDAAIRQAIDLYRRGEPLAAVGRQLGASDTTIWNVLRLAGVQLRDRHGRERPAPTGARNLAQRASDVRGRVFWGSLPAPRVGARLRTLCGGRSRGGLSAQRGGNLARPAGVCALADTGDASNRGAGGSADGGPELEASGPPRR